MKFITRQIMKRIQAKRRGWVFAAKDFLDLGARATIDKVLSRLASQGIIRRLDRGVYDFPKQHPMLGTLSPDTDSLARVAAKAKAEIFMSGASAANAIGLSTQVPAKVAYMTNGRSCTKKIAGQTLVFKHARIPILAHRPDKVNLALQALSFVGKDSIDEGIIQQCAKALDDSEVTALMSSAPGMPTWLANVILKIRKAKDGQGSRKL